MAHTSSSDLTAVLERKVQELNSLIAVSARITSQLGLDPVLQGVVDAARELVGADMGGLLVLDADRPGRYAFFKVSGWPGPAGFPEGRGLFALPYKTGQVVRVADIRRHPDAVGTPPGHPPVGAFLAVPLSMRERVLGSLFLAHRPGGPTFSAADEELLVAFSVPAAIAIENARLYAKAEQLAVLQERARISRRLHDTVSQIFFALGIAAERLGRTAAADHVWREGLGEIRRLVQQGLVEVRAALFALSDDRGPDDASEQSLEDLVRRFERTSGVKTILAIRGSFDLVPAAWRRGVRQVVAESLNNVFRHSRSPVAFVSVVYDGAQLAVSVQDAGVGIGEAEMARLGDSPTHFGVRSMKHLVEELGGTFAIFRNDEGGTTVRVQIPRPAAP
ncbi:MAG: GAF domain-containing protein [Actinomycetia bacterium]|nr:GAF domain-containing protein [Actinomycetes bacterium]